MTVVFDDVSMAFSVDYNGYVVGVNGEVFNVAGDRQHDLYVLVGIYDRSRPPAEIRDDLIRR